MGVRCTILSIIQWWGIILGSRASPQPSYIRISGSENLDDSEAQPTPSPHPVTSMLPIPSSQNITRQSQDRLWSLLGLWHPFFMTPRQSTMSSFPQAPAIEAAVQASSGLGSEEIDLWFVVWHLEKFSVTIFSNISSVPSFLFHLVFPLLVCYTCCSCPTVPGYSISVFIVSRLSLFSLFYSF